MERSGTSHRRALLGAGVGTAASPATGFAKRHERQQAALVAEALGLPADDPIAPKTAAGKKLA